MVPASNQGTRHGTVAPICRMCSPDMDGDSAPAEELDRIRAEMRTLPDMRRQSHFSQHEQTRRGRLGQGERELIRQLWTD